MKKKKIAQRKARARILALVFLIAGGFFFLLPTLMQKKYEYSAKQGTSSFQAQMESIEEQMDPLYERLLKENKSLYENGQKDLVDPFSYEVPGLNLEEYGILDNVIGYVEIPRLGQSLPIYLGASKENMRKGGTQMTNTSYPIGGENTNSVIAAHRDYYQAEMFRYINLLQPGDLVYIHNFRETLTYRVANTAIVHPTDVDKVLIQEGKDLITLMSCHPYGENTQRYLVYCERVVEGEVSA